jgi:outer membrane protein TolC
MKKLIFIAVFLVLLFNGYAFALTMEEAVESALKNNHRIKQFKYLESSAREKAGAAKASFLPSFGLGYSYTEYDSEVYLQGKRTSVFTAEATYNLFNGMSDLKSLRSAELNALASGYQRKAVEADIILAVKTAYIRVLRAGHAVETAKEGVELLERQQRDAELYYREGLIARNDLLKVEVELASARQELLQAETNLRVERKRLERIMGVRINEGEAIEDFNEVPDINELSFEVLKEEVLERRSELRYLKAMKDAYEYRMGSIKGGYLPSLDLTLAYSQYGDSVVPDGDKPFFESEARVTVTASWNIFDGFKKRHDINEIRYLIRAAEEEIKDTEEELLLQLKDAVESYKVSKGKLDVAKTAVSQAEENYRVTESQFRQRMATVTDLLDARFFLTRARNQYNNALYDLYIAVARIERVTEKGGTDPF